MAPIVPLVMIILGLVGARTAAALRLRSSVFWIVPGVAAGALIRALHGDITELKARRGRKDGKTLPPIALCNASLQIAGGAAGETAEDFVFYN